MDTDASMKAKASVAVVFIYTSFPALSSILLPWTVAKPFTDYCLLRHGVPEKQGTEKDRDKEMHPHSVALRATYFCSRSVSKPNLGLGHRSTFTYKEGKDLLSRYGHLQHHSGWRPRRNLTSLLSIPLQTLILSKLNPD